MKTNILDRLRRCGEEVNDQCPLLNYGGCGVYAELVGKSLIALGITPRAVIERAWSNEAADLDLARRSSPSAFTNAADLLNTVISLPHIKLKFVIDGQTYVCDSDDVQPFRASHFIKGSLSIEELCLLTRDPRCWNSMFDREQIPAIAAIVQRYLQE